MPQVVVADASSPHVPAAKAVLRAIASRSSGSPDREWVAFLEQDLRILVAEDATLAELLCRFGWEGDGNEGRFAELPDLEELRCALPVFTRRSEVTSGTEERLEFERRVLRFINKVSMRNARQAAEEFCAIGLWSQGAEREWRLHAFAALMLRNFAKLARYRPAKGNLFQEMSILGTQVGAVCELIECTPGLRQAVSLWICQLLGCQPLWAPQRLAACTAHVHLAQTGKSLGTLPNFLLRRVLDFLYPEIDPVQAQVARALPPHAERTEAAIILGHLLWSCPSRLWQDWGPLALAIVDAQLSVCRSAEAHHAGLILFAVCGRLTREPTKAIEIQAAALGPRLAAVAEGVNLTEGFMRHRIASAVEVAARIGAQRESVAQREAAGIDCVGLPMHTTEQRPLAPAHTTTTSE